MVRLVKKFVVVLMFASFLANANAQGDVVQDTSGMNLFVEKLMNFL